MSEQGLTAARETMEAAGVPPRAIEVFAHHYAELEAGATGMIHESDIDPLDPPPRLADAQVGESQMRDALARTVVIKLNGGLGTSMGMDKAKSLLPVRGERTFLDIVVEQVRRVRSVYDTDLPLILMDSFRTREDTLDALTQHPDVPVEGLPLDFLQNKEPKLRADDLTPVSWPKDPTLEWTPPGHGDLYTALDASGTLAALIEAGYRYASVSNSDNLGSYPSPRMAGWFAQSSAPYAAEVCRRTPADVKGGYLVRRKSDGRLVLRETAQTPKEDQALADDTTRHRWFHTNNLWFDLEALAAVIEARDGVLGLPLIKNVKTVDPTDPTSPEVIQVESAMGAAVEVFDGAVAIEVERERFLPVKTTDDLLLVRSDFYDLDEDFHLVARREDAPLVRLDKEHYKLVRDFDARFPRGPVSLADATAFTVQGDWTFGAGVRVVGEVTVPAEGSPGTIDGGTVLEGS
ncbi:UTP--glucose-1-phosphate uridylyltransferase [Mumia sp. zg.B17]|uniref:UTP--glucose-1-phosphate uridylyltransferase n=1 Tax=Mumia sp. zg.B17 TaxID=2855446 RepID=UPI001C6E5EE1|nr:UTP--glucose-1-phosphate uridylyltransferase [Mumia sp. zg.B17]MBW9206954.1 UTP--glucose-1-phosphate uridylyltransferase [Mumia sp. zg.B17]